MALWPKFFVGGLILSVGLAEALALQSVLLQEQTSNGVDSNIRGQLLSFHLTPQIRDRFFFSLPSFPERAKLWRASFSQFDGGGEHIMLVYEYGFLRSDTARRGTTAYLFCPARSTGMARSSLMFSSPLQGTPGSFTRSGWPRAAC